MKRIHFSAVCAILLVTIFLSGCTQSLPIRSSGASGTAQITLEQARETALDHANVGAADVRWSNSELDFDNGRYVYELEFKSGGFEFSYDIDTATGQILKSEKDFDD